MLTQPSYIPGHIHAFYLEYVYYRNQEAAHMGRMPERAPGIFSNKVQNGGSSITTGRGDYTRGYDNTYDNNAGAVYGQMPAQGGGYQGNPNQAGYGTVDPNAGRY